MQGILRLTATAAIGGLVLVGCGGEGSSDSPDDDVTVNTCAPTPGGGKPEAAGAITNRTTKASGYTFRVRFLDPAGNEVTQAANGVARVEAGATATWRTEGAAAAKGPLTCAVVNATRTAVGG